jgi:hypothetical protein
MCTVNKRYKERYKELQDSWNKKWVGSYLIHNNYQKSSWIRWVVVVQTYFKIFYLKVWGKMIKKGTQLKNSTKQQLHCSWIKFIGFSKPVYQVDI